MKRIFPILLLLCLVLTACDGTVEETTAVVTVATTTAEETLTLRILPEMTETEPTAEPTTEATTVTTEATTTATTAATTAKPKKTYSPHTQTVLAGDYTYDASQPPVIESVDGFTYVNGILIVNKTYPLPADFDPGALHPDTQAAFDAMQKAAKADGLSLRIISGYRPYSQQNSTYNNYAKRDGKELADRYSARPGHSEHQSGFAIDLNSLQQSFGDTPEGLWIAEHCAEYGFILRYGKEKETSTGFMYEPWHLRYLGVELATTVTESGLCLEEFLGISSVYAEQ